MMSDRSVLCAQCYYALIGDDLSGNCPKCSTKILTNCDYCKYDLSDTDPNSNCPECGIPAIDSAGLGALQSVHRETLRSVVNGFYRLNFLINFLVVSLFGSVLLMMLMEGLNLPNAVISIVTATVAFSFGFAFALSWRELSIPVGLHKQLDAPATRLLLRFTLCVYLVSISLIFLSDVYLAVVLEDGTGISSLVENTIEILGTIMFVLMYYSQVLYLNWYAKRLKNQMLQKQTKILVWGGVAAPLAIAVVYLFLSIGVSIVVGSIVAVVVALYILALPLVYWMLIYDIYKLLKKLLKIKTESLPA